MKLLTPIPSATAAVPAKRLGVVQSICRRLFLRSLAGIESGQLLLEEPFLGEVTSFGAGGDDGLVVSIIVHDPDFYRDVVVRGALGAGEAWTAGWWDCPDLEMLVRIMLRNRDVLAGMESGVARAAGWMLRQWNRLNANSRTGSRRNIAAHYDLGNEFFATFLDASMTYSSAIFDHPGQTLHAAQMNKIDRLCRKLEIGPEDHVLEIGTGWGSFAIRAAQRFGARVTTTTISKAQYEEACRRVAAAGVADRVTVLMQDYRDLTGTFDKIASIEMVEAVGDNFLDGWFAACSRLLKPDGCMAFQAITITDQNFEQALKEVDFIKRYIFPGSFIPCATRLLTSATRSTDLRLLHMEDFGPHYAETLRRWRHNLHGERQSLLDAGHTESFLRMWTYYLDYCAGGFEERYLGVAQFVFRKPRANTQPLLGRFADSRSA